MQVLVSYNPGDDSVLGEVPVTDAGDYQRVLKQARQASIGWQAMPMDNRVALIREAFGLVDGYSDNLARLLSREMGKDLRRSMGEVKGAVYGAGVIAGNARQALQPEPVSARERVEYQPLGVCGVISPWNYPLAMAVNLMVPALVAGNVVIFKPSEETPLIADHVVQILNQVLPDNVLQIIHGDAEVGRMLVDSDIDIVAFTGSRRAGKEIMQSAAKRLTRLVMELGGNDPMLVLNDADLQSAARFAVASSFENAGQMCTSTERIYVDSRVAEAFEQQVVAIARQYSVGQWNTPRVNIGPIINSRQHQKITEHISDAVEKGARLLLGETAPAGPFIPPTVLADITPQMLTEQEETFGPVVAISRFNDLDDAVARANASDYGLGAVVFGGEDAAAVASRLQAGMVAVNQGVGAGGDSPWVGAKQSGFGFHGSAAGHRQFAQLRVMSL